MQSYLLMVPLFSFNLSKGLLVWKLAGSLFLKPFLSGHKWQLAFGVYYIVKLFELDELRISILVFQLASRVLDSNSRFFISTSASSPLLSEEGSPPPDHTLARSRQATEYSGARRVPSFSTRTLSSWMIHTYELRIAQRSSPCTRHPYPLILSRDQLRVHPDNKEVCA
ncbi:hypothetical protein VTN77DRAFT_2008 [Rasamsonia byssochlamydoides]|uniref:uncharacterized protein n=1 Tax=Rasamsonia byssochlamydoides TaxID=89139 RepID=UPI0037420EAF